LENGGTSSVSQSAKLLIDVFEKLQNVQETQLDLTILVQATSDAVREKFPEIPYEQHMQAVTNSASVRKLREQLRAGRVNIEATKKALLEESN
jgi:hypothetical protein